jgi:hypothetical protein
MMKIAHAGSCYSLSALNAGGVNSAEINILLLPKLMAIPDCSDY